MDLLRPVAGHGMAGRDGGPAAPLVFLHGFGSTKEDYADVACQRAFTGRPFLAYDAPGCGQTCCADLAAISIPFLVKTARAVLDHAGIRRFHLVGHSMGGLTALLLAHQEPDRVLSLVDIEGNPSPSSALFAASLRHKVRPGAVRGIFESMVDLSDHGDLMPKFLALPCPRMFMYGEANSAVSYLADLAASDVELAKIPYSGHWPMYANPVAMWERIAAFIGQGSALPVLRGYDHGQAPEPFQEKFGLRRGHRDRSPHLTERDSFADVDGEVAYLVIASAEHHRHPDRAIEAAGDVGDELALHGKCWLVLFRQHVDSHCDLLGAGPELSGPGPGGHRRLARRRPGLAGALGNDPPPRAGIRGAHRGEL
jgi:pimeloyl-ACP methyl ester carboxylesterase